MTRFDLMMMCLGYFVVYAIIVYGIYGAVKTLLERKKKS